MLIGEHIDFELQTCFLLCYRAQKNWRQNDNVRHTLIVRLPFQFFVKYY